MKEQKRLTREGADDTERNQTATMTDSQKWLSHWEKMNDFAGIGVY
jgi:hypothetical protein